MNAMLLAAVVLVGGTVHVGDGEVLTGAKVLIEGDKITGVGANIVVPAGATVIDVSGKVITPGLIDAMTTLGLVEISGVAASNDTDPGGDLVRAAQRAVDSYNPHSVVIPIQRAHGVTAVLTAQRGGLIGGQAAVYNLAGVDPIRAPAGITARVGGRHGGARGAGVAKLREVLDDARTYARRRADFERNQARAFAASRLDLEALQPLLSGEIPLFVSVDRRSDIRTVLRLAREFGLRVVIVGGAEAWQEAEALAADKVPVILDPVANQPVSFDALHTRGDAAARLIGAGVSVALSTFSAHSVRKLRQWAGNAVRAGLSHADALAAVTRRPALILGLSDRGLVAVGKVADLVVWSGDPFELSTRAERVYIGGRATPLEHRQRALFHRYRTLPSAP
jgi:imidazolonepropionase-like amidohydrolase